MRNSYKVMTKSDINVEDLKGTCYSLLFLLCVLVYVPASIINEIDVSYYSTTKLVESQKV